MPDYFLSAHEFRSSSLSSVMGLSGGRYTQLFSLSAIGKMHSEFDNWGWGRITSSNGENSLKQIAITKDEIWMRCFLGSVCSPLLCVPARKRRVLLFKFTWMKSVNMLVNFSNHYPYVNACLISGLTHIAGNFFLYNVPLFTFSITIFHSIY